MLILISPAKTQDFDSAPQTKKHTTPVFLEESEELIKELRKLDEKEIGELMHVSEAIAELNFGRYKAWDPKFTTKNAKQALLAFKGDVYRPFHLDNYTEEDFKFAQEHLRMLSGLYGILRPLDLMQAYRLEMKIPLKNKQGKDLYAFWGDKIAKELSKDLKKQGDNTIINLASMEYFKATAPGQKDWNIITPVFKEKKEDGYKMVAIFAKKARGMMSDYIIQNRITKTEDLKGFNVENYKFNKALSSEKELVFTR